MTVIFEEKNYGYLIAILVLKNPNSIFNFNLDDKACAKHGQNCLTSFDLTSKLYSQNLSVSSFASILYTSYSLSLLLLHLCMKRENPWRINNKIFFWTYQLGTHFHSIWKPTFLECKKKKNQHYLIEMTNRRKESILYSNILVKYFLPSKNWETITTVHYTFDFFVPSISTGSRLLEIPSIQNVCGSSVYCNNCRGFYKSRIFHLSEILSAVYTCKSADC